MKKLLPILLLLLIFAIAAVPYRPQNRSCEFLKRHPTAGLLLQCLFGTK